MGLFLSYSSRDRTDLEGLLSALHRGHEDVWFDDELGGGEVWWQAILERIRGCEVFVFALSNNALQSKPCLTELRYAQELGKPVIPIQIGPVESLRVTPLAAVEAIDFRTPTVDSGIRLMTAVQDARERVRPLPSPLPDEPPVPFAYLMRLATAVVEAEISPQEQADLFGQIRTALGEDGDDPATRRDIAQLVQTLRAHPDATDATKTEADHLLAALGEASQTGISNGERPSRKWLIAAVAAVVFVVAAIVAVVAVSHGKNEPATAQPATAAPTTPSPTKVPLVTPAMLDSILLSQDEITAITGVPDMQADDVTQLMYTGPDSFSDPDCLGADTAAAGPVYEGSGFAGVRAQTLNASQPTDPTIPLAWVEQAAVSFPSEHLATAFLNKSADRWEGCNGQVVKQSGADGAMSWTYGDLTQDQNTISQLSTQEGGGGWDCQHTLTAYSNVVLEAVACNADIQDEASRIVEQMVGKAKG